MSKIKICNLVVFTMVALLTLFCSTPIYADDTSLGRTPEGVFPMQENDVIMESEQITVDLEKNRVECIFVFHNTQKSKNVYMGFPGKLYHEEDGLTQDVNLELHNFKTFVKGKELTVTKEKATKLNSTVIPDTLNYSEYFTFTVPFKKAEKVTVRNTYDFVPTYDSIGYIYSGYVLKTGALWKGPIGSAKVTFKMGKIQPYQLEHLKPGGFKFVGNDLVWERSNFEPTYDLRIDYNDYHYSEEYLKGTTTDEAMKIKQKIASYSKVKELANKSRTDELLTLYNKAVKENNLLALYIRRYLPKDKLQAQSTTLGDISISKEYGSYYAKCDVLGQEAALIEFRISHIENGNEIQDIQEDDITSYDLGVLTPGTQYNITYKLTDWLNRTEQKTLKYKAPEQPSASVTTSASSDLSTKPVAANEPVNNSVAASVRNPLDEPVSNSVSELGNPVNELIKNQNSKDSKLIIYVLFAVILMGLLVVAVVVVSRKQQK